MTHTKFTPGQLVYYVLRDPQYPLQLQAVVIGDVEGWVEIELSDNSHTIVRPSRLRSRGEVA